MKEAFLHYVWKTQSFTTFQLKTTDGEPIQVVHVGMFNQHSGPDFQHAQIRIGQTLWVGQVEIHIRASDWVRHRHHLDKNYENTILHVCYIVDEPVKRMDGTSIPHLELKSSIDQRLIRRYREFKVDLSIPCSVLLKKQGLKVFTYHEFYWKERMDMRSDQLLIRLAELNYNWQQLLYESLASGMGMKVNKEAFGVLAQRLPYAIISRHSNRIDELEALLFGVAGFLDKQAQDMYTSNLQRQFRFLEHKYKLRKMKLQYWKYSRLRPAGFPDVRLAQLAILLHQQKNLWGFLIKEPQKLFELENEKLTLQPYWQTHYRLGTETSGSLVLRKHFSIKHLLINTVVPIFYAFGRYHKKKDWLDKAGLYHGKLKSEKNTLTRQFSEQFFTNRSAMESQALIHLYQHYCSRHRCLDCALGCELLQHENGMNEA